MKSRYYLLWSLMIILTSCKKDIVVPAHPQPSQRTLLVFMGGDNNLYKETFDKVEALRKGYQAGMGRLLIFQAAKGISPKLMEIRADVNGIGQIEEIKTYENKSSANAAVFKEVLKDVREQAPSESYGLILFSHASGWLPQRTLIQPRALIMDKEDDMELRDFAAAIPDHFFDFMVFESCFMSGIEVMYELKDKTDYILSSSAEILSPGFTPIYDQLLGYLYKPEADLHSFAMLYFEYYNQESRALRAATVSVTATRELDNLAAWAKQNAVLALQENQLDQIQHFDRYSGYQLFFDFEDYYKRISAEDSHAQLSALLKKAVPFKFATDQFLKDYNGFDISAFSGLTSYIPQNDFAYLNTEYKKLKWTMAISKGDEASK